MHTKNRRVLLYILMRYYVKGGADVRRLQEVKAAARHLFLKLMATPKRPDESQENLLTHNKRVVRIGGGREGG